MKVNISYSAVFGKFFKKYLKKHRSLKSDLEKLYNELLENPKLGTHLGDNLYKIRIAVKSKNKGKSGGFRVVTYLLNETEQTVDVNLLIIYDKSDIPNISKKELIDIVKKYF